MASPADTPLETRLQELAFSKAWLRLLHYRKNLYGQWRSQLDGSEFFFAPDGHMDPLAELKASLQMIDNTSVRIGPLKQPPRCAFPERFRFLIEKLNLRPASSVKCDLLEKFIAQFHEPQSVSVVFSSAYQNNPASMFGHTLLKFNSNRGIGLLDTGINFAAAVADDENPFAFAWFGLTGGYRGLWSAQPFYVKVDEYVNVDSRDLWEYQLSLTAEETSRLIHHLWELEATSYFKYYFFDENCSYQILAALEAIRTDWTLNDSGPYLIPGESIKRITRTPGAVQKVVFRPSQYKKLRRDYDSLNAEEKKIFFNIINKKIPQEQVQSRSILNTVLSYMEYLRYEDKSAYQKIADIKTPLLSHRASLGPLSPLELASLKPLDEDTRPDFGHDSYSLSLSQGYMTGVNQKPSGFTTMKWKSAYHDLLNKDLGYARYAHIDFPWIQALYSHDTSQLFLDQVHIVSITSLPPLSLLSPRFSWKFMSGIYTPREYGCRDCKHAFTGGGIGGTVELYSNKNLMYLLAVVRAQSSLHKLNDSIAGPGIEYGVLLNLWANHKFHLRSTHYWNNHHSGFSRQMSEFTLEQSLALSSNWELRNVNRIYFNDKERSFEDFDLRIIHFFN